MALKLEEKTEKKTKQQQNEQINNHCLEQNDGPPTQKIKLLLCYVDKN